MGDINVAVSTPTGKPMQPKIERMADGKYYITFVPDELGAYK